MLNFVPVQLWEGCSEWAAEAPWAVACDCDADCRTNGVRRRVELVISGTRMDGRVAPVYSASAPAIHLKRVQ